MRLVLLGWGVIPVLLLGLAGIVLAQPPAPPELTLAQWLSYDQQLPLDASRTLISEEGDLISWRVEFSTAHNKRVPALLIEPKGALEIGRAHV